MYQTNTKKYRSIENCRSKYSSKLRSNLKRFDKNLPLDFTRSYLEDRISRSDSRWIGLIRRERWKRVERDRVKSTEGGLGNFAETRDRSWLEFGSRVVGKRSPRSRNRNYHSIVRCQSNPIPARRRDHPRTPSQQPRVIARSTAEEKGLQSIGLILGRALNSTDVTLPRFPFCIEFPGGNYETRPRRRGMIFVTFERRGIGCVIGAGGEGERLETMINFRDDGAEFASPSISK